jgi:excisionase family DNA binding protein
VEPEPDSCTLKDAYQLAGVSRRTLYNWLNQGKVEAWRTVTGRVRIDIRSLRRMVETRVPWKKGGGD